MSTFSAVFLKHLTWVIVLVLKAFGSVPSRNASNEFMAYNFDPASRSSHAYAVYDVRGWRGPGTLSFLFNTHKSKAFLAYQDDRTYSNFDLFIDRGNIRARINLDKCPEKEIVIQGNFSDSRWHRIRLTRELRHLTLTVDGCHSTFVPCDMSSSEREEWYVLYVGGIPWSTSYNSLAKPIILFQAMASVFQGCIGHVTQSVPGGSPRALPLRHSAGTGKTCESRCASIGKCHRLRDDVSGEGCECPEYEVDELMCKTRSSVGSHYAHSHTITATLSSEYHPATWKTSFIVTPGLVSSRQSRILRTTTAPSIIAGSSTQTLSTSDHAQNADNTSSVPRNSSSFSRQGLAQVSFSSISLISPHLSSSDEVAFSSSIDSKLAAMAKKSSVSRPSTFGVVLCVGVMIVPVQMIIMNN